MPTPTFNLPQIQADLQSADQATRFRAMNHLLLEVRKDPSLHDIAKPIFRHFFDATTDDATKMTAARGIEALEGPEAGRKAWIALLNNQNADTAWRVASTLTDPSYAPAILELMQRRSEPIIHITTCRVLARMKYLPAFDTIATDLRSPQIRPHAIDALGELGDPRAIPLIEPYLAEKTDAWPEDNHGPMVRVCDVAQAAINRLKSSRVTNVVAPPSHVQSLPPVMPPNFTWRPKRGNLLPFLPLILAVSVIPWFGVICFCVLFIKGNFQLDRTQTHLLDFVSMIPALLGVLTAVVAIVRKTVATTGGWICLVIGVLACCLPIFMFGNEMLTP